MVNTKISCFFLFCFDFYKEHVLDGLMECTENYQQWDEWISMFLLM